MSVAVSRKFQALSSVVVDKDESLEGLSKSVGVLF